MQGWGDGNHCDTGRGLLGKGGECSVSVEEEVLVRDGGDMLPTTGGTGYVRDRS